MSFEVTRISYSKTQATHTGKNETYSIDLAIPPGEDIQQAFAFAKKELDNAMTPVVIGSKQRDSKEL
jgi:hypothetical protein